MLTSMIKVEGGSTICWEPLTKGEVRALKPNIAETNFISPYEEYENIPEVSISHSLWIQGVPLAWHGRIMGSRTALLNIGCIIITYDMILACADRSTDTLKSHVLGTFLHFWAIFSILEFVALHCKISNKIYWKRKSCVTCHESHITCGIWHVTSHMSYVTFHLSLTPTAKGLPLLTPPLFRVEWFQIQKRAELVKTLINHGQKTSL